MLERALEYVRRGYRVFPLSPGSKKPYRESKGLLEATRDEEIIKKWWEANPGSNIGLATGSGLVVLDVDPFHGGDKSLAELLGGAPPWQTPTVITGKGGLHFYFKTNKEIRNTVTFLKRPGLDVRGDGGYVVVPPSVTTKAYEWDIPLNGEMAEWPFPVEEEPKFAEPIEDMIPEGERNSTLASLAGSMRRRGMSEDEIYVALTEVNKRANLPDNEVKAIARSVSRYKPEIKAQISVFPESNEIITKITGPQPLSEYLQVKAPPISYLINKLWTEKAIGFVSGHGGSFKSFFAQGLAFALANGRKFLDMYDVPEARRVLYIQHESSLSAFQERTVNHANYYGYTENYLGISNIEARIWLDDDRDVDRLREWIERERPSLLVIDPLADFHRLDENSTQNMQRLKQIFRAIRDDYGTSVLLVHHWNKNPSAIDSLRGNTTLRGMADISIYVDMKNPSILRSYVSCNKFKDGEPFEPFSVKIDPATHVLALYTPEKYREQTAGLFLGKKFPTEDPEPRGPDN